MNFISAEIVKDGGKLAFKIGETMVTIAEAMQKKLESHVSHPVKLGVRSHQITITGPSENAVPMQMQLVENLGKELLVSGKINDCHIRMTVEDTTLAQKMRDFKLNKTPAYVTFSDNINVFYGDDGENLCL